MLKSLAIVGAGVMGGAYARAVTDTNLRWRVRVVGVCDTNEAAASELAGLTGATAFTDVSDMLAATAPDAVYIATPDVLHADPFFACIEHGVPVLVEKPLATDPQIATRMRQAAIDAGVYAECNFTNRTNPVFVQVKNAIDRGDIGEVIGVNARLSNAITYPTELLRWASTTSSGWFLLSHIFDLASWLTGAHATEVTATGSRTVLKARGVDTYDLIHALVRYDTGLSGIFESSWTLPSSLPSLVDFKYAVLGSDGALYVDTQDQMIHLAGKERYVYPGVLNWTEARLSQFLDTLESPDRSTDPLLDGLDNTLLLVALHEALASGSTVHVESAATASAGEDGR